MTCPFIRGLDWTATGSACILPSAIGLYLGTPSSLPRLRLVRGPCSQRGPPYLWPRNCVTRPICNISVQLGVSSYRQEDPLLRMICANITLTEYSTGDIIPDVL